MADRVELPPINQLGSTNTVEGMHEWTISKLFEAQVERTPDATAAICGGQELSYEQLNRRANQLARLLRRSGVRTEDAVAVGMPRSLEMAVAIMGIFKAGAAYLPLDITHPRERLDFMLDDARPTALLTSREPLPALERTGLRVICLDLERSALDLEEDTNLPSYSLGGNSSYVMYTSGTSGRPKGVINVHSGTVNRIAWMQRMYHLECSDRVLQKTSHCFDVSVWEFVWPLVAGARLVIAEPSDLHDMNYLVDLIVTQKITSIHFVPSILRLFLESTGVERCTSLRQVFCSGEALTPELQRNFFHKCNGQLHNLYGPTEASIDVSSWQCKPNDNAMTVPIGKPISNTRLYILDKHLRPAPIGVEGELYIAGVALARGYLGKPGLTAERFVPNPFGISENERMFRTGDIVLWGDDGNIEFHGRRDNQVKIRGCRVELGEIETILRDHGDLLDASVIFREDKRGEKRLVAFVAARPGKRVEIEELRAFANRRVPGFMVPDAFVPIEKMPLLSSGKVDQHTLAGMIPSASMLEYAAPRNAVEEIMSCIWSDILKVPIVGIRSNFFELGGNSLLAMQVVSRIRRVCRVDIQVRSLLDFPTIEALAERVRALGQMDEAHENLSIANTPRPSDLPLSCSQERLWFVDQTSTSSDLYIMNRGWRLLGNLDVEALDRSIRAIIARHESLRTTFGVKCGEPFQVIRSVADWHLGTFDLSTMDLKGRNEALKHLILDEATRPFDLAQGPLVRSKLVKLGHQEHILLVSMHHIVWDGWSWAIFDRELGALYRVYRDGTSSQLETLRIQYADYAISERRWLEGEEYKEHLKYWKKQLRGTSRLSIPTDRERPKTTRYVGARQSFDLSRELSRDLVDLAAEEGATLFMILLAIYSVLLMRYSTQNDVAVGIPIANRNRLQIEGLGGFFVNTLVLRTDLSGNPTFREALRRTRETTLKAFEHQQMPFDRLVAELRPSRDLTSTPLFQTMLSFQNISQTNLELSGLSVKQIEIENASAKFDLTMYLQDLKGRLVGQIEYKVDLFEKARIERMVDHWKTLVGSVLSDPDRHISTVNILPNSERERLLRDWGRSDSGRYPSNCIHELVASQAQDSPVAVAIMCGQEVLTYQQLNTQAEWWAQHLRACGVDRGDRIAVVGERSLRTAVTMMAIWKAGGIYVPLDPAWPRDRLLHIVEEAAPKVLIGNTRLLSSFRFAPAVKPFLDSDWSVAVLPVGQDSVKEAAVSDDPAYLIYTSGSSGRPKGVLVGHRNLLNTIIGVQKQFGYVATDRAACIASFGFDISLVELLTPLVAGGSARILTQQEVDKMPELVRALHDATILHAVPSLMHEIVDEIARRSPRSAWEGMRLVLTGGDAVQPILLQQVQRTFSSARVAVLYGPTEAAIVCCSYDLISRGTPLIFPIGKPLDNVEVRLYDDNRQLVPIGVPGEIYLGGAGVCAGYWKLKETTVERFPVIDGARFYRTGDIGKWTESGDLCFLGRRDRQVKIGGCRVELGEIERLLAQHPNVREASVVVRDVQSNNRSILAFIVPKNDGPAVDCERLIADYLRKRLPKYMVPAVVQVSRIPKNSNNKIDRAALTALPVIEFAGERGKLTQTESILIEIWCDLLGRKRIRLDQSFFEVGGHSLLGVRLLARVQQAFGITLSLHELFENDSVRMLALKLDDLALAVSNGDSNPTPIPNKPELIPLSPAQLGLWVINRLDPDSSSYNVVIAQEISGPLDLKILAKSLGELVQRHESLRTRFVTVDYEPFQVVLPNQSVEVSVIDLESFSAANRSREAQRIIRKETSEPFDLTNGPLFRTTVLRMASTTEFLVILAFHHIAADGWSLGIMIRELSALYEAHIEKKPSALKALPFAYTDYAIWKNQQMASPVMQSHIEYWKEKLTPAPVPLTLDSLSRDSARSTRKMVVKTRTICRSAGKKLRAVCNQESASAFMVFLAAFQLLLHQYSGESEIVVGTTVSGRGIATTHGIVGNFTNLIPLHATIKETMTFRDLLSQVRETCLNGTGYHECPFSLIVKSVGAKSRPQGHPLVQIGFHVAQLPYPSIAIDGLKAKPVRVSEVELKFDLDLNVQEVRSGYQASLAFRTDRFRSDAISLMLARYDSLVARILLSPDDGIGELKVADSPESGGARLGLLRS